MADERMTVTTDDVRDIILAHGEEGIFSTEIAKVKNGSDKIPTDLAFSIRACLAQLGKKTELYVEQRDDKRWYRKGAPKKQSDPRSGGAVEGSAAPAKRAEIASTNADRPGVELTLHQTCDYQEVVKLEYLFTSGWAEQATWSNIDVYYAESPVIYHPQQTKAWGVSKIRIMRRGDKGLTSQEVPVPPNRWVILAPKK